jgi:hypothetical protein
VLIKAEPLCSELVGPGPERSERLGEVDAPLDLEKGGQVELDTAKKTTSRWPVPSEKRLILPRRSRVQGGVVGEEVERDK